MAGSTSKNTYCFLLSNIFNLQEVPNQQMNCLLNQQKTYNPIFTSFIFELIRYNYVPVVINVLEFLSIP